MIRPVMPKNTPMFTAAVWLIILRYVVAPTPSRLLSHTMRVKSSSASGDPVADP